MSSRKPTHYFALALVMALFAFYPVRLNPESFTAIDVAAMIFFGLVGVILAVLGILGMRRNRSI